MARKITSSSSKKDGRRIWPLLLILGTVVFALWGGLRMTPTAPDEPAPVVVQPVPDRELTLYFATVDGTLVGETRLLPEGKTDIEDLRSVVMALIAGPRTRELSRVLPESVRILDLDLQESTAVLDFSREFVASHPGGSVSELLTIYSLVDTLAVNFPYVRQIRIQVEGKAVETIKGHADLHRPIAVDFSYVKDTESATPGDVVGDLIEKHGSGETE